MSVNQMNKQNIKYSTNLKEIKNPSNENKQTKQTEKKKNN